MRLRVAFAGCASHKTQKSLNRLDERMHLYGRMLRWQEYEEAATMVRHKDESPIEVNLEEYKNVHVVDYEIKTVVIADDQKSAVVEAEISYYHETRNTINTIRDNQNWWYAEDAKTWFIDGSLPAF